MGESLECDGEYDLTVENASACPLYGESITTTGLIVDYFDVTPHGGPQSFTILSMDGSGQRMEFVIWPESSDYQDGFDITATDLNDKTLTELNKEYPEIKVQKLDSTDNNAILEFTKTLDKNKTCSD